MRLSVCAIFLTLTGCGTTFVSSSGWTNQADHKVYIPDKFAIRKPETPTQRFLNTNTTDVAYDTATGSFCKTWRWSMDSYVPRMPAMARELPTCLDLTLSEQDGELRLMQEREKAEERKWRREHPDKRE